MPQGDIPDFSLSQMPNFYDTKIPDSYHTNGIANLDNRSVAELVLTTYGIPYTGGAGGPLKGMDINHLDAMGVLKSSLLEDFVSGALKEPIVNEDGVVEFVTIGASSANITDVYYQMQTFTSDLRTNYVKVIGKKEQPIRKLGRWINLIADENGGQNWDTSAIISNCNLQNVKKQTTITFKDPHRESTSNIDGIDSIYDHEYYEHINGWAWFLDTSKCTDIKVDTTIAYQDQSSIAVKVCESPVYAGNKGTNIGTLVRRTYDAYINAAQFSECYADMTIPIDCSNKSIFLDLSIVKDLRYETIRKGIEYDKFKSVSKIFIEAIPLNMCYSVPISEYAAANEAPSEENSLVIVGINDATPVIASLSEGEDYTVAYYTDTKKLCVQFFNNADTGDGAKYGQINFVTNPSSGVFMEKTKVAEKLKSLGVTLNQDTDGNYSSGSACIFPKGKNSGYLILKVYAQVELDTPSVVVYDPSGKSPEIAQNLKFYCAAMTLVDPPAPIAIDGKLLDQKLLFNGGLDEDPTTVQDLINSPMELYYQSMDGGNSIEISLPTLNEDQTIALSSTLSTIINSEQGLEVSYVCGPNATPKLGGQGRAGGVVNNIRYSYSDSGSYTITVNEGPRIVNGLSSSVGGGPHTSSETITAKGIITESVGNGISYKVLLDGIGVREALNGTAKLLRKGDSVNCTIYNNPSEVL